MKIFVSTCDTYDHLLPGFAYLFNKYWGPVPITVLGFRPPTNLPANFAYQELKGKQTDWTSCRRPIVEQLPADEPILWLLDDYWFYAPVYHTIVDELCAMMCRREIAKGDLSNNTKGLGASPFKGHPNYLLANPAAPYRSSTQTAIWRKDYLLKLMIPGYSIWQFEIQGQGLCANDKQNIAAYDLTVCRYANIYYKGGIENFQVNKLAATDLQYMWDNDICREIIKTSTYIKAHSI
jgi:hypothetical protein